MDPSIRLDFVLGNLRVDASELKPAEWVSVVRAAIDLCRPLKYLSGLKTIGESLNNDDGLSRTETDIRNVDSFPGFSVRTRFVHVGYLLHSNITPPLLPGGYKQLDVTYHCHYTRLLLTQEGWLVLSDEKRLRHYTEVWTGTKDVMEKCVLTLLDDARLQELVTPKIGLTIIQDLRSLSDKDIKLRQERLQSAKERSVSLRLIDENISISRSADLP